MKKETIFKHEINESIQGNAALNCLNNRNNHKQMSESADFDAEDFISNVVNLMEDEGMIDDSQWDEAYYTVEEMIQSNPELLHYPSYMQFLNVFGDDILSNLNNQEQEELSVEQEELPQMERRDMILALSEYMAESWIDTGDSGDLDDIYYAVADILDKTGDYPASTNWEDCKPWCQKHYREIEAKLY